MTEKPDRDRESPFLIPSAEVGADFSAAKGRGTLPKAEERDCENCGRRTILASTGLCPACRCLPKTHRSEPGWERSDEEAAKFIEGCKGADDPLVKAEALAEALRTIAAFPDGYPDCFPGAEDEHQLMAQDSTAAQGIARAALSEWEGGESSDG